MTTQLLIELLPILIPVVMVLIHKYTPWLDTLARKNSPDLEKLLEDYLKKLQPPEPSKTEALFQKIVEAKAKAEKAP